MNKIKQCGAANPDTCRYHGKYTNLSVNDLKQKIVESAKANNTTDYLKFKDALENKTKKQLHTSNENSEAKIAFLTVATEYSNDLKQIDNEEYEIYGTDQLEKLYSKLEDKGIEIETRYPTSGVDVLQEIHIPELNKTITNTACDDELRDILSPSEYRELLD